MTNPRIHSFKIVVLICAALFSAAQPSGQSADSWPPQATEYRFHMIGNAHIDAPWLWPWPESMSVVLSTFRSALDRMKENPDFTFTASSAQFYEWVAQVDPKMMEEIRQRVKEGRWDVVGGWWVEPDVNIPNGESLVRQGLYGQEVFQQLFGHRAEIAFNPDAFGHPATLPQILKLQGMHAFVFMRPLVNEKTLPGPLFWWQSPDGSRVLAYRIPVAYNIGASDAPVFSRLHEIDACEKVRISGCEIFSGDDAIVLKSTLDRPCRDVAVTNCVLSSLCYALKLGTESVGGFQNIAITDCTVYDSLAGIAMESVDGGVLENVTVSNIVMRNVKGPIFLRLGNRARPAFEGAPTPGLGSFQNVMISDIQAIGADGVGCAIAGLPERAMENITLANIRIQFRGGGTLADASREIPELPVKYPDYNMFGVLPASGFYCRHVKNLRLLDTQVAFEREDLRPTFVCADAAGLRISDFAAPNSSPVMVLRDTRDAWLEANRAPQGNKVYLRLEGRQTENIYVAANGLRASEKPLDLAPGVRPQSVLVSPPMQSYRGE